MYAPLLNSPVRGERLPLDLPEPGQVVQRGGGDDDGHVGARAAVRANRAGAQGEAHGHVPLHGHAQGLKRGKIFCDFSIDSSIFFFIQ